MTQEPQEEFFKAAGGLVWRQAESGKQILVVHRARYDDWSLPKGKLEPGESWPEAAVREVMEETGFSVTYQEFAGVTTYYHGRRPKVVLFWHMTVSGEPELQTADDDGDPEVDQVKWLDVDQVMAWLTYPAEQALVAQNLPDRG